MKKDEKSNEYMHPTKISAIHMLTGKWTLYSLKTHKNSSLVITYNGNLYLNEKRLRGKISEVSHHNLIFTDCYDYQLIFKKKQSGTYQLYDELGEQIYTAYRDSL